MSDINPFLIPDSQAPEDRSFIDLSFDGVAMSELGLIVIFEGDAQTDQLTPQFTNNVSTIPGRNGVIFWNTEISNGTITRKLGTDCMTSRQYNKLKQLLTPGKVAKLILAERPYCYAWAYIQGVPQFSFVPYDKLVIVNGEKYTDVVYKGTCSITWNLLDPHWFGDSSISTVRNYAKQSWIFQSGMPLDPPKNIILSSDQFIKTAGRNFTIYNAGNAPARAAVKIFTKAGSYGVSAMGNTNWTDIEIKLNGKTYTKLIKPRIFQDVEYIFQLLSQTSNLKQSNFETHKAQILNNLRDNLDSSSQIRDQLIFMVQATFNSGSSEGTYILPTLKTAIRQLIESADFTFIIDALNKQMVLITHLIGTDWYDQTASSTIEIQSVQNIEGVSNGVYITIDGNSKLSNDFTVTPITMQIVGGAPTEVYVQFVNEYE